MTQRYIIETDDVTLHRALVDLQDEHTFGSSPRSLQRYTESIWYFLSFVENDMFTRRLHSRYMPVLKDLLTVMESKMQSLKELLGVVEENTVSQFDQYVISLPSTTGRAGRLFVVNSVDEKHAIGALARYLKQECVDDFLWAPKVHNDLFFLEEIVDSDTTSDPDNDVERLMSTLSDM